MELLSFAYSCQAYVPMSLAVGRLDGRGSRKPRRRQGRKNPADANSNLPKSGLAARLPATTTKAFAHPSLPRPAYAIGVILPERPGAGALLRPSTKPGLKLAVSFSINIRCQSTRGQTER